MGIEIADPLSTPSGPAVEFEAVYETLVRKEIERFRERSAEFLAGAITEDAFRPFRLSHGTYGQRQAGMQMIRVKIPGGLLDAAQVNQLALIADQFAGGRCHLTTRQDIQYHFVPLAEVPELMHKLADVRLTTREACFNTVRNVTCCPVAGLAQDEIFDVTPWMQKVAFAFLRKDLTANMPRKFKIAFSGCPEDCVRTDINDIGLRATIREENGVARHGFRMSVGGGLGPLPNEARVLDEFVPVENLVPRCESVIRVFNQYGNRKNKNKARLKFVVLERGFEWLKEAADREYADILQNGGIPTPGVVPEGFGGFSSKPRPLGQGAGLPVLNANGVPDPEYDRWLETNVAGQKQPGYALVTIRVDQGNLTSEQMRGVSRIAADAGDGLVRITIAQNWMLGYIPAASLKRVYSALKQIGLAGAAAGQIEDIVTCPGAYTCNLGLTKSMNLGAALRESVAKYADPVIKELAIRISGCPNSCGQHWIGDIGFYGNARKIEGKEIPYYSMLLGGGYDGEGRLRFGLAIQSVAARLAPAAVDRVLDHFAANRLPDEKFRAYVLRYKVEFFRELTREFAVLTDPPPELFQDWGDDEAYSLKLGRGECAA
ncbi:MAG: nitrite/sulfite reductase [Bryobacteraceae bacterium]